MARSKTTSQPKQVKSVGRIKQVAARVPGAPYPGSPGASGPLYRPPVFRKSRVRTLQKVDPAKGITQPEGANLTDQPGIITGDRGGFKGGVAIKHQLPAVPPKGGTNRRVVKAPSPTSGAGVRSPFSAKTRVGKRGSNKRFKG